ncbi:MAG: YcaQ family DNA glycosylase [Paraglaciecola sp.]|nr:YcaQ family DNA glycosylase [Paraglaciecola sp.]
MLPLLDITQLQARKIALIAQGLHKSHAFGQGINGTNAAIQHLSYIQIDSISVIQRAHHHCLWSRVKNYQADFIEQLIAKKKIFEYWSHAAAYLPIEDYRFTLPKKQAIAGGEKHWRAKNPIAEKRVLQRIQQEGPLRAKDFEYKTNQKSTGWWDWKPDKIALEQLFIEGVLMVVERRGFQKVYDLAERVLPDNLDTTVPSANEFERYLITRCLKAHGLATIQQICYLRKGLKSHIGRTCQEMLENNELRQVTIGEQVYYALPSVADLLKQAVNSQQVNILSPFDNTVIQRKRLSEIFAFDYQIECYVPPEKRQYGYFSLPLLWGTEFVGRMDCKIDRKTQILHIQNLHLETKQIDGFIDLIQPVLLAFIHFNEGTYIQVHKVTSQQALGKNKEADIKRRLQML